MVQHLQTEFLKDGLELAFLYLGAWLVHFNGVELMMPWLGTMFDLDLYINSDVTLHMALFHLVSAQCCGFRFTSSQPCAHFDFSSTLIQAKS